MLDRRKLFLERYPKRDFCDFSIIGLKESQEYLFKLALNFGLDITGTHYNILLRLREHSTFVKIIDETTFKPIETLKEQGNEVHDKVFVNYFDFSEIYEISSQELDIYFDDLYFPYSDDVEIFDKSCSWVLFVTNKMRLMELTQQKKADP